MGRRRRNCPILGCGSTNLARLANHLHQVHHMNIEERSKWLKWSKMGICLPYIQAQETVAGNRQANVEETLTKLLKHQENMEKNFYNYFREVKSDVDSHRKQKPATELHTKERKNISCHREAINTNNGQKWLPFDI
jgi:hypothetical protein